QGLQARTAAGVPARVVPLRDTVAPTVVEKLEPFNSGSEEFFQRRLRWGDGRRAKQLTYSSGIGALLHENLDKNGISVDGGLDDQRVHPSFNLSEGCRRHHEKKEK